MFYYAFLEYMPRKEKCFLLHYTCSFYSNLTMKFYTGDNFSPIFLAPKRKWTGRGYSMFGCGNFGRRCSANSGSGKGGEMGGNQSPSSNVNIPSQFNFSNA
jgi:hypothetical protein